MGHKYRPMDTRTGLYRPIGHKDRAIYRATRTGLYRPYTVGHKDRAR